MGVLLTIMIMHATQMAQIIYCNKRAVLIGPKVAVIQRKICFLLLLLSLLLLLLLYK